MSTAKILICEDERNIQKLMAKVLIKKGYEIYSADDGQESIEKTQKISPDVILLDIRMPKIDGLEAAREIRKFNQTVKIIFITGFESPQISQEANKYNIFAYIVKPVSQEEILQVVEKALKS